MRWCLVVALLLGTSAASAAEKVVWQIGQADHSYREFACAGNFEASAQKFGAKPIIFEIGRSDPARDWPFIQPGPADQWAPGRGQPWTIRFNLPEQPAGIFKLRIDLADVHSFQPPRFVVALGDRAGAFMLPPGGGDASLTNPQAGKPQKIEFTVPASFFRKGVNEIHLTCTTGAWVQYDAITLWNDPQAVPPPVEIKGISARATPFFIRRDGRLLRVVEVGVTLSGPAAEALLNAEADGKTSDVPVMRLPPLGSFAEEVGVPDLPTAQQVKITATVGKSTRSTTVLVKPERKWRVYVAASAHTDVGYTDVQPKCAERHNQNIDTALDLIRRFPGFCWNLEVAWQAENYIHARSGQRLADFYRYAKEGKIGVQALYANMLTGLCSHEEACRLTWFAHRLCREHGIEYRSAMITDVPTQEWSLPTILNAAGIRYFSSGINNDRAYNFTQLQDRCPCWWEGPDGSRVLMIYAWVYFQAEQWGLTKDFETARRHTMDKLSQYAARKNYPFDAVFLHGAISDNCPLNATLAEVVKQWNQRYEYPKLILSRNAEFFQYIEKHYADKLPVYRGSAGTYWEDGAGSSARETTLVRRAHEQLTGGQGLSALASRAGRNVAYPADTINAAWRNCLLYDEHTWGAYCSIGQPDSDFTKAQWKIKSQFAVDAAAQAKNVLQTGGKALAGLVKTAGPALVVFNPSSWLRTDVLRVDLPEGVGPIDRDLRAYRTQHGTFMIVKDVPPCGYRTVALGPAVKQEEATRDDGRVIESRFYRVEFDPATGGIVSIRDKELDRELVDPKAPFKLNQLVYAGGGSHANSIVMNAKAPLAKLTLTAPGGAKLQRRQRPGVCQVMAVEAHGDMVPTAGAAVIVWDHAKRIDILDYINKKRTYAKEAVYFAFPFAAEKPTFRYEAPLAIVNANRDMLPGACLDWFTVQHFVEVEGQGATVAWATPDAPLVCFQDINRGKWLKQLPLTTGHLYAYLMNNYWHTNYCAGQGGDYMFRFAITSRPKSDPAASARFGAAAAQPLTAVVVEPNPLGSLPGEPTSLVSVEEPGVMITAMKRSEDGKALIVRLWELTGKATTAHLRIDSHLPAGNAWSCNLVEDDSRPLPLANGVVSVPIRGAGVATVKIE
jgi:alpha-mannosidase